MDRDLVRQGHHSQHSVPKLLQFQEHLILGVGQHQTSEEEYLMQAGLGIQKVKKVCNISGCEPHRVSMLQQHFFIFEHQGDRKVDLKRRGGQQRDEAKRRTVSARSQRGLVSRTICGCMFGVIRYTNQTDNCVDVEATERES